MSMSLFKKKKKRKKVVDPCIIRPCSSQYCRKKNRRLAVVLGVSRELRPRSIRGWVAFLFCVKTRRLGRRNFVALIRVSCQKAVQSQGMFPSG